MDEATKAVLVREATGLVAYLREAVTVSEAVDAPAEEQKKARAFNLRLAELLHDLASMAQSSPSDLEATMERLEQEADHAEDAKELLLSVANLTNL